MSLRQKLVKSLLTTVVILVCLTPYWVKLVPARYLQPLTGKVPAIDQRLCNFPVQVGGQSLAPLVKPGTTLNLDRCLTADSLQAGTVVLYAEGTTPHLGIIRAILPQEPTVYVVSDEKAPELFHNVLLAEITAFTNTIDVSQSQYRGSTAPEAFTLDPNEFIAELYLGKIPQGSGLEQSPVEPATTFDHQTDQFCSAIVVRQALYDVDTKVINRQTQAATLMGQNIIFPASPKANINCEAVRWEPGQYQYQLSLRNQVLAQLNFEVR